MVLVQAAFTGMAANVWRVIIYPEPPAEETLLEAGLPGAGRLCLLQADGPVLLILLGIRLFVHVKAQVVVLIVAVDTGGMVTVASRQPDQDQHAPILPEGVLVLEPGMTTLPAAVKQQLLTPPRVVL